VLGDSDLILLNLGALGLFLFFVTQVHFELDDLRIFLCHTYAHLFNKLSHIQNFTLQLLCLQFNLIQGRVRSHWVNKLLLLLHLSQFLGLLKVVV
jgi:hypothetical protein